MVRVFEMLRAEGGLYLELFGAQIPTVPEQIPHIKLAKLKEKIKEHYGYDVPADTDIDSEGEKLAGKYASEVLGSDFLFVTHYPMVYRPFYTMPDPESPEEACGFDLLFRGLEIVSGGQRIHKYDALVASMAKKGVAQEGLDFYLETFKFAMPPHGGWGLGSERVIQKILELESIKEACLFPRDVKRLTP
jgi:nondiscriminating aspartyl-tRNA synthetase